MNIDNSFESFPIIEKNKIKIVQSNTNCKTGKIGYATISNAQKAQKLLKKSKHKTCKWYKCDACGEYHLTSKKKKIL